MWHLLRDETGFTLLELVMVIIITGIALPVLLVMLGQGARMNVNAGVQIAATGAGQAVMEEIRTKRWDENTPPPYSLPLGPEGGETRAFCAGTPSTYDDIDDYHGYTETCGGYTKTVSLCYVPESDFNACVGGPTDFKRISVTVSYPGMSAVELVSVMANY